jgi:hypothetical protein
MPFARSVASAFGLLVSVQMLAAPVHAAPITRTYDVVVNNVHDQSNNNVPAPVTQVAGSFTVTFDPALGTIVDQTSGITVNSLNVTVGSPIAFSYSAANSHELQIGGLDQGTNGLTDGVSDFLLDIFDADGPTAQIGKPFFGNMDYTIFATTVATGQFSDFAADSRADGTVTVRTAPAVPEPPTFALFLAGCLLSGAIHASRQPCRVVGQGSGQRDPAASHRPRCAGGAGEAGRQPGLGACGEEAETLRLQRVAVPADRLDGIDGNP